MFGIFQNLDIRCVQIVSYTHEEVVVVFRGTISKMQLIMQGWQSLKPGNDFFGIGKVNQYFDGALKSLWPNIKATLQTFKGFNVTFTGHSLGGALASLAAVRSVVEGVKRSDQVRLYTFGQPRVGNAAFASKHKELVPNSFRIVFREDFVAHIPPCSLNGEDDDKPCDPTLSTHFHHGAEIWYSKQMPRLESHKNSDLFTNCAGQPRGEDFACSETIHFDLSHLVGDHYDHKHYFGRSLGNFGELGCDPNLDDEDAELVGRVKEEQKRKCQSRCGAPFFSSAKSLGCQNGLYGATEECGPMLLGTRYICAICD
uniref:Fungal lipase-like domain-containing protein n=1 Tax=Globodera rostochiensis TaxID=31243 RepID=A0A914I243_GLORO